MNVAYSEFGNIIEHHRIATAWKWGLKADRYKDNFDPKTGQLPPNEFNVHLLALLDTKDGRAYFDHYGDWWNANAKKGTSTDTLADKPDSASRQLPRTTIDKIREFLRKS